MFFNEQPYRFFPQTQIDIVHFPEGPGADTFTEKVFIGPLNRMLEEALSHIRATVIQDGKGGTGKKSKNQSTIVDCGNTISQRSLTDLFFKYNITLFAWHLLILTFSNEK